ncbi:MAG TPA: hypothetical protein VFO86_15295 [Terriglobia bacterium]|nr:hypothetical protein [Terriglobia bacterium]
MAKSTRPTANKRAREKARIDRQKEKERRRAEVREKKASAPTREGGEDPDIAGIVAGPQPRPDWLDDDEDFDDTVEDDRN